VFLLHLEFQLSQWQWMGLLHLLKCQLLLGKGNQHDLGIFIQPFIKNRILSNVYNFYEHYDHKLLLWQCSLKHPHRTNARWLRIIWHFPRLLPPSNLQLYCTKLLHVLPSIIWYKWVNAFSSSALLVRQHTKNYTLPSSSTPNLESLHHRYCQYYFTI
jgi:hypothetical protein